MHSGNVSITYTHQLYGNDYLDDTLLDSVMLDLQATARGRFRIWLACHLVVAVIVLAVGTPACNRQVSEPFHIVPLLCKAQFWGNLFISETLKSNAKNIAVLTAAQRANMLTSDYVVSWERCRRPWGICVRVSEPMDTQN